MATWFALGGSRRQAALLGQATYGLMGRACIRFWRPSSHGLKARARRWTMRVNRSRQELAAVYRKPYVALDNPSVKNRAGLAGHVALALACVLEVRHLRFFGL